MTDTPDPNAIALLGFLDAQRACVLDIVDGLDEQALRTAVLPSGWTPLGLIEHLGDAERHWFGDVATGASADAPWTDDEDPGIEDSDIEDSDGPFATDHPAAAVLAYYRDQFPLARELLARQPLSAAPVGRHIWDGQVEDVPDLRWIVLHMIEETARHAGHLDVARELLDGVTGLGPR